MIHGRDEREKGPVSDHQPHSLLSGNAAVVSTIGCFDGSRKNNFTLLRLILAWLVLYGHAFAIQSNPAVRDPMGQVFQGSTWIGDVAVNAFFLISGFLIAASLERRTLGEYFVARMLRIYPALVCSVFLLVFAVGPAVTVVPLQEYFSRAETYDYLRNALLTEDLHWTLPGVFDANRRPAVNGSMWTLPVEIRCYMVAAVFSVLGGLVTRKVANSFLVALFAFGVWFYPELAVFGNHPEWARPCLYFMLGMAVFVNRTDIVLDHRIAVGAFIIGCASFGTAWFPYAFPPCVAYLIFYLAYKAPYVRTDEMCGDMSYGIYIYAWPIQQSVAYVAPDSSVVFNILVSTVVVLVIAQLSWRFIERPSIFLGKRMWSNLNWARIRARVTGQAIVERTALREPGDSRLH